MGRAAFRSSNSDLSKKSEVGDFFQDDFHICCGTRTPNPEPESDNIGTLRGSLVQS